MLDGKAKEHFDVMRDMITLDTNKIFVKLMLFQWFVTVVIAWFTSPLAWRGEVSSIHIHVWAALFLGGSITAFTILVTHAYPTERRTRHFVAVAQMLMSILIIHVSGGRIESHFHIFGSLAFLAFYIDPWVLVTASVITALDHYFRGLYWPMSAYGEAVVSNWRWLEHGTWVIFEDVFLIYSSTTSLKNISEIAKRQSTLEEVNSKIEIEIVNRTSELEAQRARSLEGEKMAALGEMAAGMAHEINNPIAVIQLTSEQMQEVLSDEVPDISMVREMSQNIHSMGARIGTIVKSLKNFARNGEHDPMVSVPVSKIIDETLVLCKEKFRSRGVELKYEEFPDEILIECRPVQISQIVLNLLHNALDATEELSEKWVSIQYLNKASQLEIYITDSGNGIPEAIRDKILQPFFTTKDVGKGTGLGLSISKGIMEAHSGELTINAKCKNTQFVLTFKRGIHETNAA
jgi:two-component system sensor histidine kinase HydH